jgi:hypothetical protein
MSSDAQGGGTQAMHRVVVEQTYEQPPEEVFEQFAEHENLARVIPLRVERVRDGNDGERNGVGSARRLSLAGLMPFEEAVTEYVPSRMIRYRITKGAPLRGHRGELTFDSRGEGSTLRWTIEFERAPLRSGGVVARVLQRSIARGLARLPGAAVR